MNRPDKRNAVNPAMALEMLQTIDDLEVDDRCKVLVLTGAGESFSAGMDLKEYFRETDAMTPDERARIFRTNAQ
jgi:feruloyl-CoA hydratase/lyase